MESSTNNNNNPSVPSSSSSGGGEGIERGPVVNESDQNYKDLKLAKTTKKLNHCLKQG